LKAGIVIGFLALRTSGRKIGGLIPQKAISAPREGVSFFRQTNFDLDNKCVKLRIPAGIE
jgi:hypothetical protein